MIAYDPCSGTAYCSEDLRGPGSSRLKEEQQQLIKTLKPIDPKAFHRLEKVRDLMLFRHGGTGVAEVCCCWCCWRCCCLCYWRCFWLVTALEMDGGGAGNDDTATAAV